MDATNSSIDENKKIAQMGKDWTMPDIGMEFVWIKALDCWVGKYEVTNGEYRKFKPDHDSKDYKGKTLNGVRQPVVYVNFDDATEYASILTRTIRYFPYIRLKTIPECSRSISG